MIDEVIEENKHALMHRNQRRRRRRSFKTRLNNKQKAHQWQKSKIKFSQEKNEVRVHVKILLKHGVDLS